MTEIFFLKKTLKYFWFVFRLRRGVHGALLDADHADVVGRIDLHDRGTHGRALHQRLHAVLQAEVRIFFIIRKSRKREKY